MNGWQGFVLGAFAIALASPVHAQTLTQTDSTPPPVSTRAADLLIEPRAGAGYSTSGGGYDGFGSFQGFIPVHQTPGKDLLYLVGQLLLDNEANLGGNAILGYRYYSPGANRIFGAYLAYDNRDTGSNIFSQFGVGLETLGEGWDARLNAYIPVGSTRQTVSDRVFDSGLQVNNLRFQDHFLLLSGTRQQQRVREIEAAMAGFDLEAGGRLLRFGSTGELRGYAGLYYLAAGEDAIGVRGRLEARPWDYVTVGLGVQHDRIFGTNVVATVALSFPSSRPKGVEPKSVLARMGEYPGRLNAIVVDQQREIEITGNAFTDLFATNPATGQPYFFQHVTLGTAGGNGTFESPFGTVQLALNATRSDGNDIVYVQAGSNPGIPAFTIPNRVQVLSTGPVQVINTNEFGLVQLFGSGSGVYPQVNGTVTMGSDTVLSGFTITSTTGAGVTFSTVNKVEVRDNFIRNTADAGILGNGVAIANLFRNQITAATNQGIYLQNVGTATVTDNTVNNTIAGNTTIANPLTGDISLGPVTIPNPGSIIPLPSGQGIVLANVTGQANVSRNAIAGTGRQGLVVLGVTGNATIADNTVSNTVGADFTTTVPTLGAVTVPTGQGIVVGGISGNVEVTRNTVSNVRGQGIAVAGALNGTTSITSNIVRNAVDQGLVIAGTSGTTTIANNQISDIATRNITIPNPTGIGPANIVLPTGQGIVLLNSIGTVNLTGNTVERVQGAFSPTPPAPDSGQGIVVANFAGDVNLTLANNLLRTNFNDGVLLLFAGRPTAGTTAATGTVTITGNTIENNGNAVPPAIRGDGIGIGLEQDAVINNLLIENNTIRNNGDEGIDIRLGLQAVPVINPTTARLTGTIRNNTITNNGQNGVQVEARGATTARVTIDSNNASNNGQRGLFITANNLPGIGTPQIAADVRLNTLSANAIAGFQVTTTGVILSPQTICVNLTGNTSTNPSQVTNAPSLPANTLQVVNLPTVNATNTGGVVTAGIVTSAASCP